MARVRRPESDPEKVIKATDERAKQPALAATKLLVGKAPLGSLPADEGQSVDIGRSSAASNHDTQAFVFEVVRHRGHWRTLYGGKHSSPFPDQATAVLAAKKLARQKKAEGHCVEVILRRTDGDSVVQSVDTDECSSST